MLDPTLSYESGRKAIGQVLSLGDKRLPGWQRTYNLEEFTEEERTSAEVGGHTFYLNGQVTVSGEPTFHGVWGFSRWSELTLGLKTLREAQQEEGIATPGMKTREAHDNLGRAIGRCGITYFLHHYERSLDELAGKRVDLYGTRDNVFTFQGIELIETILDGIEHGGQFGERDYMSGLATVSVEIFGGEKGLFACVENSGEHHVYTTVGEEEIRRRARDSGQRFPLTRGLGSIKRQISRKAKVWSEKVVRGGIGRKQEWNRAMVLYLLE